MQELNNKESITSNTDVENQNISDIEIEIEDQDQDYSEESINDDYEEKSSRFKEGEILSMIRVRFPGNSKSFPFFVGKRKFAYGQKVVAMSDRGMTVGYINSFPYDIEFNKTMLPIRSIAKVATEEDIKSQQDFRDSEKKAEVICIRLIDKYNLDMVLTHVEFIQFGKKAVFYFNAPERVDFRELVKDLVADLKMRIELRQISVRDRAAALGAVGACGLQTCCSSFLKNYGNVSIKMAKNQNLALIPSKLNGVCGQIKCCIKYEDDVYADKRKNLPKENTIIRAKNGDIGKVLKLHLLVEQFELLTDFGAKRRYAVTEFIGEDNLPQNYKFPETFDHVVDETKEVIGLIKEAQKIAEKFLNDIEEDEELYIEDGSEEFSDDDDYEDDENSSSTEEELKNVEMNLKDQKNSHKESNDNSRDTQRTNQQSRHQNNNQNRNNQGNRNNNQNRDNRNNNRNFDNKNNQDRNFKPRHNNNNNTNNGNANGNQQARSNGENRQNNPNPNQSRNDRPNPNRDNRNNNRNFKPRHNHNNNPNQQRNNDENRSQNNQNNKENKKPE